MRDDDADDNLADDDLDDDRWRGNYLRRQARMPKETIPDEDIEDVYRRIDRNNGGTIDADEFLLFLEGSVYTTTTRLARARCCCDLISSRPDLATTTMTAQPPPPPRHIESRTP